MMIFTSKNRNNLGKGLTKRPFLFCTHIILVLSLLSFFSVCFAQDPNEKQPPAEVEHPTLARHNVGLGLAHEVLFGTWNDRYNDDLGFHIYYHYEATQVFGFIFNAGYADHSGPGTDELKVISLEPDLRVNFIYFDNLVIYGMGGFGFYPTSQKIGRAEGHILAFGLNLALGVELRLDDSLTFGPGIQFKSIFSKTDSDAVSPTFPNGIEIGGEEMRLYVQAGYSF